MVMKLIPIISSSDLNVYVVLIGPTSVTKGTTEVDLCQQGICNWETAFFISPTEEDKLTHLEMNLHLKASVAVKLIKEPLWFADYVFSKNCADVATIAVHLKALHKRETCDPQQFAENAKDKQHLNLDRPSHIISEIVYGFNAVFVFDIPIESKDKKTYFANKMYLQAKKLFSNPLAAISSDDFPLLKVAKFRLHTDLNWQGLVQHDGLFPCLKSICSLLRGNAKFVPVQMTLSSLPNLTIRDMEPDVEKKLFSLKHNLKLVQSIGELKIGEGFLKKFPRTVSPLLRLEEFKKCLEAIDDVISCTVASNLVAYRRYCIGSEDIFDVCRDIYNHFFCNDVLTEWLLSRQNEILSLTFLFKDITLPFHTRELAIEELDSSYKHVECFVFRIIRVKDDLISTLKERLCLPDGVAEEFPTFEVLTLCQDEQQNFIKKLQSFCNQVFTSQYDAYLIASESLNGGTVKSLSRQQSDVPQELAGASPDQSLEDCDSLHDLDDGSGKEKMTMNEDLKTDAADEDEIKLQLEIYLSKMDTISNFQQIVVRLGRRLEFC